MSVASLSPHLLTGLIDAVAVAALLRCDVRDLGRLADQRGFPRPIRVGRLIRWNERAVAAWIGANMPTRRSA